MIPNNRSCNKAEYEESVPSTIFALLRTRGYLHSAFSQTRFSAPSTAIDKQSRSNDCRAVDDRPTATSRRKTQSFDKTPLLQGSNMPSYTALNMTTEPLTSQDPKIASSSSNSPHSTHECDQHNAMTTRSTMPLFHPRDFLDHRTIDIISRVPERAIRVERDYSRGDGITRFSNDYPPLLTGKITEERFRHTIQRINEILLDAERVSWNSVFDNIMECFTLYTWPIFFSTHYQRCIRRLQHLIQNENETVYQPHNILIANPVRVAFLFLELRVFDD